MHPQTIGYRVIQYFNPRFNLKIEATKVLYHYSVIRSRKMLSKSNRIYLVNQ